MLMTCILNMVANNSCKFIIKNKRIYLGKIKTIG